MKYMGSKNRIAKHILPIILKDRKDGQWYVEPFVGGANMIDKVNGNRIGADSNFYLIEALKLIRSNIDLLPENNNEFTEDNYNNSKPKKGIDHKFTAGIIGVAGFAYSFGAKWFGGWSRGKNSKGVDRDYVAESHRNLTKQSKLLQGINLFNANYFDLTIPKESIIYCDIPYFGTTKYKDAFGHERFWQWCREKTKAGHKVFISEYNAPADFVCVWEKEIQSGLNTNTTKKGVEKLFIHESQYSAKPAS